MDRKRGAHDQIATTAEHRLYEQLFEYDTNPLIAHLPLLAGHLTNRIMLYWHVDSATCGSNSLLVLTVAHLYNACRTAGHLKES